MQQNIELISGMSKRINSDLAERANEYLVEGLKRFHSCRESESKQQVALGLMLISIELMLKTIIAKKNLSFLFDGLDSEVKFYLTAPDSIPKGFNTRVFELDLLEFNYKTLHFDGCVGIIYLLFPELKHELKVYFKDAAVLRNKALHGVVGSHCRYETDRIAYLALRVGKIISHEKLCPKALIYVPKKEDLRFLERYEASIVENVKKQIEASKRLAKKMDESVANIKLADVWREMVVDCPICKNKAKLKGETEHSFSVDDPSDDFDPGVTEDLSFLADSFECVKCGLKLPDSTQMGLANISTIYDRSDMLEEWHSEFSYEPHEDELW